MRIPRTLCASSAHRTHACASLCASLCALPLCSGPSVDDLFRAVLIPRASPPVEVFINVTEEELNHYPRVNSVQAMCGPTNVRLADGLQLFGTLFELADCSTRVGINQSIAPLLSSLVPTGPYLLAHPHGNLPVQITVNNVLSALRFGLEWESAYIAEHNLEADSFSVMIVPDEADPSENERQPPSPPSNPHQWRGITIIPPSQATMERWFGRENLAWDLAMERYNS